MGQRLGAAESKAMMSRLCTEDNGAIARVSRNHFFPYGGLSTATARKLEQAAADPPGRGATKPAPPISLRLGTRLVRGWRGFTHMVLVHADGIGWRGQRYRSLSVVARKITGARWSGPRFFGLRRRQLDSYSSARAGHGQG
jgi:hypothetical protein